MIASSSLFVLGLLTASPALSPAPASAVAASFDADEAVALPPTLMLERVVHLAELDDLLGRKAREQRVDVRGDLGDLRRLGEWSSARGAELLLCNPLHASVPVPGSQQSSPYYPTSRCFRNPIFLRVEEVPAERR